MPAKKRAARVRVDPERELRAWRGVFRSGYDYLHALRDVGVPTVQHQPAAEAARDAWARLGTAYLATAEQDEQPGEPWGLRTFGDPAQASRPPRLAKRGAPGGRS